MAHARLTQEYDTVEDQCVYEEYADDSDQCDQSDIPSGLMYTPIIRRVDIIQSPFLNTYYNQHPVRLTLDTGATTNMVKHSFAKLISVQIKHASQMARQADGVTPLGVIGEVHCDLTRTGRTFMLYALVVKQLDVEVLAGNPFLVANDIAVRPAKWQIIIGGSEIIQYGPQFSDTATIRRTQSYLLRSPSKQTVVLSGEFIELPAPIQCDPDTTWALEPRIDSPHNNTISPDYPWPNVQEIQSVAHTLRLANTTSEPILLRSNEHICQVRPITTVDKPDQFNNITGKVPHIVNTQPKPYSALATVKFSNPLCPSIMETVGK